MAWFVPSVIGIAVGAFAFWWWRAGWAQALFNFLYRGVQRSGQLQERGMDHPPLPFDQQFSKRMAGVWQQALMGSGRLRGWRRGRDAHGHGFHGRPGWPRIHSNSTCHSRSRDRNPSKGTSKNRSDAEGRAGDGQIRGLGFFAPDRGVFVANVHVFAGFAAGRSV
jgi:hypothetical protein